MILRVCVFICLECVYACRSEGNFWELCPSTTWFLRMTLRLSGLKTGLLQTEPSSWLMGCVLCVFVVLFEGWELTILHTTQYLAALLGLHTQGA